MGLSDEAVGGRAKGEARLAASRLVNWKLIALLGLAGVLPPLGAYALGGSPLVSVALWTLLAALVWVPVVLRSGDASPFLTLVLVGLASGVCAGLVDTVMLGDPMLLVVALLVGAVWGALFGGVALGVRRWRGRAVQPA